MTAASSSFDVFQISTRLVRLTNTETELKTDFVLSRSSLSDFFSCSLAVKHFFVVQQHFGTLCHTSHDIARRLHNLYLSGSSSSSLVGPLTLALFGSTSSGSLKTFYLMQSLILFKNCSSDFASAN